MPTAAAKTAAQKKTRTVKAKEVRTTDVLLVTLLDRSGSMDDLREWVIRGFNKLVADQISENQEESGRLLMTLVQFDDRYEPNFVGKDVYRYAEKLKLDHDSYIPRGSTALHHSVGTLIGETEQWIKENEFAGRVLFIVMTDGYENHSRFLGDWTQEKVQAEIKRKERDDWTFVYMGTDVDAVHESRDLGMSAGSSLGTARTAASMDAAYTMTSSSVSAFRASADSGAKASANFYADRSIDAHGTVSEAWTDTTTGTSAPAPVTPPPSGSLDLEDTD